LLAFLVLLFVGLAHPAIVLAVGALLVAVFGGALLFWKD
jgi:hypothetical protein